MNSDIEVGFLFFENLGRNERLDECPDVSKEAKASIENALLRVVNVVFVTCTTLRQLKVIWSSE